MKNKDIESTSKALEEILSYNKTKPFLIMSDNDSSFLGSEFQKVLVKYDIHHDPNAVGDHNSLGIIDNFAKRIKTILTAMFLKNNNTRWFHVLENIINHYNRSENEALNGLSRGY